MNITRKPDDIETKISALEQALSHRPKRLDIVNKVLGFDRRKTAQEGGVAFRSGATQSLFAGSTSSRSTTGLLEERRRR